MGLTRNLFPLAFLSLLIVIASAEQLLDQGHDHEQHDNDLLGSTLNLDVDDLLDNLIDGKQEDNESHKSQGQGNFVPKDASYEKTKPYYGSEQKSTYQGGLYSNIDFVGIQGFVLCEPEANKYDPIQGAVVEITCPSSYENGYNKAPYTTILRPQTDEKGYFHEILTVTELTNKYINLKKCRAYPKYSPSETCNVPANSANGGAQLSLLRSEEGKVYYTVGNLIYTPNTHYSVPKADPAAYNHPVQNGY